MNYLDATLAWINDPLNWTNPGGIEDRLVEHLQISGAAVLLGCLVAWPIGLWLGHIGRGGALVLVVSNVSLAIPTMALLSIIPLTAVGFGQPAIILALTVFAVPPLLANAYTGLREVDPEVRDAARGMGLSAWQMLWRVEVPLAVPYLAAGLRTAAVQVVATATLAVFVAGGGLGQLIGEGVGLGLSVGGGEVISGALLVAVLALAVEGTFALVERLVTPRALLASIRVRKSGATAANV